MPVNKINIRENRRGNQEQTIYRHRQYWSQDKVWRQTKQKTQEEEQHSDRHQQKKLFLFLLNNYFLESCTKILINYMPITIKSCEFKPHSGEVYSIQHYIKCIDVIKIVSDLRQVGGFLWVLGFPPPVYS